jgi:hypothetical protein
MTPTTTLGELTDADHDTSEVSSATTEPAPSSTVPPAKKASTTTTTVPDEGQLPVPPGEANVVVSPAGQPTHVPAASSWTQVALVPVEGDAPPPPPEPDPVNVPPYNATPGNLVSNAYGCLSKCIVHALLEPANFQADLGVDVETNVPTTVFVWTTEALPNIIGGVPQMTTWPDIYSTHKAKTWTSTLTGLEFSTKYYFTFLFVDDHGNEKWAMAGYTTVSAPTPDQLAGNGDGCYYQCITDAILYPGDTFDTVDLVIVASLNVDFDVAISTSEPGTIDGKPFLPHDESFAIVQDGDNDIRGRASGLEADTTYHVVVSATDGDGFTAHSVGEFHTDPAPAPIPTDVRITWERIFVTYDGDAGAWGKGELGFSWGLMHQDLGLQTVGFRYEEKLDDGATVTLGGPNHIWVSVLPGQTLPSVVVNGRERDSNGVMSLPDPCVNFFPQYLVMTPEYNSSCLDRTNVAAMANPTIETIEALPPCEIYGLTGDQAKDRCIVLHTGNPNDKYARFDAVVSFHIVQP